LSLRGQLAGIYASRKIKSSAGVAQIDGDCHGVELDVRRPELGVVVVAIPPETLGDASGGGDALSCSCPVAFPSCDDRDDQVVVAGQLDGQGRLGHEHGARAGAWTPVLPCGLASGGARGSNTGPDKCRRAGRDPMVEQRQR
jgi:hypothetical protein